MRRHRLPFLPIVLLLAIPVSPCHAENWPGWRGPRGDGTCWEKDVPIHWNGATGENIAWRTRLPGRAHSSAIVWEDRVFVTTCLENSLQRQLLCLDRHQGKILWQQTVVKAPLEKKHHLNSYASGTPVTDGETVYVTFLEADFASLTEQTPGNIVVAAYDFDGRQKWLVRPGRFSSVHGFCTSPILFKHLLIVNGDHDGDAFVFGLNKETGQTVWKTAREHKTRSYCTPIIREIDGRTQMVFSGSKCVVSLDPHDGSRHWIMDGPTEQFVASLVYDGDLLYLTAGFPEDHILAIKPDGKGNITDTHIVWRTTRGCSYVPSPIIEGSYFLVATDEGIVSCFEATTGRRLWMKRMAPHYSASLVSAEGLVHFTDDDGVTKIVRPGPEWNVIAVNELDEPCYASPAISNKQIFMRGEKHLYCIGEPSQQTLEYRGSEGPGGGKHIVLVSGDEEYRSEEALPQLGRILARHHGFRCTVLFAIGPDGTIDPTCRDNIPGLGVLQSADLMIIAARFRDLPDEQMKYIVEYVEAGKPIVGVRTATHAFKLDRHPTYARYSFRDEQWPGGFGRQVLGETWISHHGHHGVESTRGMIASGMQDHPIVRGIRDGDIYGPTDVYTVNLPLPGDSQPLVLGQVLVGMNPADPPETIKGKNDPMMPIAWTKTYSLVPGKSGRVFTTTMGASQDLQSEGLRRLLVNACYWALEMEDQIPPQSNVSVVGTYEPTPFGFGKHTKGLRPSDF